MKNITFYLLLLIIAVGCATTNPAKRYQGATREYSYEFRSNQTTPGFFKRLFSKDPRIEQAKNLVETHKRLEKEDKANKKVESEVEKIKSKIN